MVVQTFPLIGNYGIIPSDFESNKIYLKAYIVREWCQAPSNFRCEGELDAFLKSHDIVGLYDIDTRALTKIIRDNGVMNAAVTVEEPKDSAALAESLKDYAVKDAVAAVTCAQITSSNTENAKYKVALWDFGAKQGIKNELIERECEVITVPASTTAQQLAEMNLDGVVLSNGPGNPAENTAIIAEIAKLCEKKMPMFGICLGHQLLALSQGAVTTKMKYGHRGESQPAKDLETGRVYATGQNHGYVVESGSIPSTAAVSFANVNDDTCEGIKYNNMPAFSVQFHPEACAGPRDTAFLFDEFIKLMEGER